MDNDGYQWSIMMVYDVAVMSPNLIGLGFSLVIIVFCLGNWPARTLEPGDIIILLGD